LQAFNDARVAPGAANYEQERKRLKALRRLGLLDSAPSPAFDRITRLAAAALNVPIMLVSLIDEKRQWFKAHFGIDVTETPRDISFCTYAVQDGEPLIVFDATQDPRFSSNPLVIGDPQIRFYAGIPLFTHDGHAVGTLCAIDRRPRQLNYEALEALEDFACLTEDLINGQESLIRKQECVDYAAERDWLLHETVEAMPLGVVRAASSGRVRQANVWACDFLGFTPKALNGKCMREIIHRDDWAIHGIQIEQVMAGTRRAYTAVVGVVRQDGVLLSAQVSFSLKQLAGGEPSYVLMLIKGR